MSRCYEAYPDGREKSDLSVKDVKAKVALLQLQSRKCANEAENFICVGSCVAKMTTAKSAAWLFRQLEKMTVSKAEANGAANRRRTAGGEPPALQQRRIQKKFKKR
jgi:hypothetical protein